MQLKSVLCLVLTKINCQQLVQRPIFNFLKIMAKNHKMIIPIFFTMTFTRRNFVLQINVLRMKTNYHLVLSKMVVNLIIKIYKECYILTKFLNYFPKYKRQILDFCINATYHFSTLLNKLYSPPLLDLYFSVLLLITLIEIQFRFFFNLTPFCTNFS